ncbi:MAG TPA: divalent-cation tolerance protein CutA [Polyangiaceae bacterium]|nr:divalent-cation tolerance protein CutA [Polyangiaceae bacterium]
MTDASDDDALVVVLVNAPPAEAPRIGRALVERGLAACVNVVAGVTSFYFWEGKLCEDAESTLVIKTRASLVQDLTQAVKGLHPYTVPEVIVLPLVAGAGNPDYAAWVRAEATGTHRVAPT